MADEQTRKQYEEITNNHRSGGSFTQKMQALKNLNDDLQRKEDMKKAYNDTLQKIRDIRNLGS